MADQTTPSRGQGERPLFSILRGLRFPHQEKPPEKNVTPPGASESR